MADLLSEDRRLWRSGAVKPALGYGLLLFILGASADFVLVWLIALLGFWGSLGIIGIVSLVAVTTVYYMALRQQAPRRGLHSYNMQAEFLSYILVVYWILMIAYHSILSGGFKFQYPSLMLILLAFIIPGIFRYKGDVDDLRKDHPNPITEP